MDKVIHLGGEHTVTGSCHLVRINDLNILVDCGMAQGSDPVRPMEGKSFCGPGDPVVEKGSIIGVSPRCENRRFV